MCVHDSYPTTQDYPSLLTAANSYSVLDADLSTGNAVVGVCVCNDACHIQGLSHLVELGIAELNKIPSCPTANIHESCIVPKDRQRVEAWLML